MGVDVYRAHCGSRIIGCREEGKHYEADRRRHRRAGLVGPDHGRPAAGKPQARARVRGGREPGGRGFRRRPENSVPEGFRRRPVRSGARRGDPVHAALAALRADRARGECRQARVLRKAAVARARTLRGRSRPARRTASRSPSATKSASSRRSSSCSGWRPRANSARCCRSRRNFSQDKFLSMPADNWRLTEKEAPAGPMTATGIHLLDLSIGLLGPAEQRLRARAPAGQRADERRYARPAGHASLRRQFPDQRHPRHALRRTFRGLRQQGLGRGARQGPPGGAAGLGLDCPA